MKSLDCPHCGKPVPAKLFAQLMGKDGGSKTSPAKRKSSRENGRQGGRPRKKKS